MLWLAVHFPLLPLEVFQTRHLEVFQNSQTYDHKVNPGSSKVSGHTNNLDHTNKSSHLNKSDHVNKPSKVDNSQTIAVFEEDRGRNIISHCNQYALEQGIEPGISDSSALALCYNAELIARDINKEKNLLEHLAETAYQFSSQVVIHSTLTTTQHSLLIEISRSLKLFSSINHLKQLISESFSQHFLSETGFTHQIATAKTPLMSELLARSLYLKKNPPLHLHEIPVALLDCENNSKQQCKSMGLHNLGALLKLPRNALGKRFKREFMHYLSQLEGRSISPQTLFEPPEHFKRELFYIHGLRSHDDLKNPMEKLLKELSQHLRFRQKVSTNIRWRFFRFSKKKHCLNIYFSKPQINTKEMMTLSILQLPQLPMDSPVESISLIAKDFLPIHEDNKGSSDTQDLLNFLSHQKKWDTLLKPNGDYRLLQDKIHAKLGDYALYQVRQHTQQLPEQRNSYSPSGFILSGSTLRNPASSNSTPTNLRSSGFGSIKSKSKNPKNTTQPLSTSNQLTLYTPSLCYPAWLREEPLEICVTQHNDKILYVKQGIKSFQLIILKGPERITTQWWKIPQQRDYFIAGKTSIRQQHYDSISWIFLDRISKKWFLHGIYA